MEILRLSNAGVALTVAGYTVAVDAFNTDCVQPYLGTDMALLGAVNADCVAFTHAHPDHFNAHIAAGYLAAHPDTRVVCGPQAQHELIAAGVSAWRFCSGERDICGLPIRLFRTRHIGPAWHEYEHFSIMIGEGLAIITGDALPLSSNFEGERANTVIAPFAYAMSKAGFRAVRDVMQAQNLVIVHLPDAANDPEQLNSKICVDMDTSGVAVYTPLVGESVQI